MFFVESDISWNKEFVLITALLGCIKIKPWGVAHQRGVGPFKHSTFWYTVLVSGFKCKGRIGCFICYIGPSQVTFPNNCNIVLSANDDMLARSLMQVVNVLKMPSSQAAILFQDVSLLMIYV